MGIYPQRERLVLVAEELRQLLAMPDRDSVTVGMLAEWARRRLARRF
jgi:hypothetical protein